MNNASNTKRENPDIFEEVAVPASLTAYVRRIMLADSRVAAAFSFNVCATGYCYLGWAWRGRWTGTVNGRRVFDTDRDGRVFCSGQVLESRIVSEISGQPGKVFVEFQPLGHYQLLGIPGEKTVETAAAPDELNPELRPVLKSLRSAGPDLQGDEASALTIRMLNKLSESARELPNNLTEAVLKIEAADGALQIGSLCDELGLAKRSFRRRFQYLTGLTPKRFCRTLQVTKAFNTMLENQAAPLSEIALQAGFSDQAHFTRAFREFLYSSPLRLSANVETTLAKFVGQSRG